MCLDIVKQVFDGTSEKVEIGYKCFWRDYKTNKLYAGWFAYVEQEVDVWLDSQSYTAFPNERDWKNKFLYKYKYNPEFHICNTKEDAENHPIFEYYGGEQHFKYTPHFHGTMTGFYELHRVEYKGVVATGIEFGRIPINVVVARYMRILEEVGMVKVEIINKQHLLGHL